MTSAVQPPSHSDPGSWFAWRVWTTSALQLGAALWILLGASASDLNRGGYQGFIGISLVIWAVMMPWSNRVHLFRLMTGALTAVAALLTVSLLSAIPFLFCLPFWIGSLFGPSRSSTIIWQRKVLATVVGTGVALVGFGVVGVQSIESKPREVVLCLAHAPGQNSEDVRSDFDGSGALLSHGVVDFQTVGYARHVFFSASASDQDISLFRERALATGLVRSIAPSGSTRC